MRHLPKEMFFLLLAWTSLNSSGANQEKGIPISLETQHLFMECGDYRGQGIVQRNSRGDYVLVLQYKTIVQKDIILLGGSLTAKRTRLNTPVIADFYMSRNVRGAGSPAIAYLNNFPMTPRKGTLRDSWLKLISEEKCGLDDRFIATRDKEFGRTVGGEKLE